jgi:4-carboxymuconolactone decarboxylase
MSRLAPLDLNKLDPEQKKVADAIMSGPRGGLRGPFEPWLRSPILADRAQKLGEYCRFHNSLPRDLSELAICLVGRHFKAQFEFYAHARLAKEAGLAEDIIEAVRLRATPPFKRDVEKVVYDFVTEYLETNRVDPIEDRHRARPAGRGAADLVREAADGEAVRRQGLQVVQLLEVAVADVAAGLVAFPDQAWRRAFRRTSGRCTNGASQLQASVPVRRTPRSSRYMVAS